MEEINDIIELVDEQGEAVNFEHLMTLEHEGQYYIILMPASDDEEDKEDEDDDDGEVLILKLEKDDKGEDCYVTIEDDALLETLFEKFMAALDEEEDQPEQ